MDSDPHSRSEFLFQNSVDILDPVRLTNQIDVVQESEHLSTCFQSTFDGSEGSMLPQTEQHGHQWIPLFAFPDISGWRGIELLQEWENPVSTRHLQHPLKHGPSGNVVICTEIPSTDTNVAFSSNSELDCKMCTTHSQPSLY